MLYFLTGIAITQTPVPTEVQSLRPLKKKKEVNNLIQIAGITNPCPRPVPANSITADRSVWIIAHWL